MYARILALLFPILAVAAPVPEPQSETSAASQITILGSSYSGSGCPPSSVSTTISPDKTVLTYGLEQMWAYIGPNAKPGEQTRNCQITLTLQYDGEIQLAVLSGAYHGWARLDQGITGTISTTYTADTKTRTTTGKSLSGPEYVEGQVYTKEDSLETSPIIWTPCGTAGTVVIENRLSLSSRNSAANGEMSIDDATAAFSQQVAVRRC